VGMLLLVYPISRHDVWKEYKSSKSSTIAHYLYAHHFSILRFCFCHLSGGECRLMVLTRVSTPPRIVSHRLLTAACMHSASRITLHSRCICPILPPPPPPSFEWGTEPKSHYLIQVTIIHPAQSLSSLHHRNGRRQALHTHTPRWDTLRSNILIIRFSRLYSRSRGDEL
jgi:hypothetical protein